MKINKLYIYIIIIVLLMLNQIFANSPLKVAKKDYSQSFHFYSIGNKLRRKEFNFNIKNEINYMDMKIA